MKKIIISFIIFSLLTIGTVVAEPQVITNNENMINSQAGIIDVNRVMQESPPIKALQEEFNQHGKDVVNQLEEDKINLTPEEFTQRQQEAYNGLMVVKKEMEAKAQMKVKQAVEKVAKEKKLTIVLYKESSAWGGIDITMEVINTME